MNTTTQPSAEEITATLAHFSGSKTRYRHWMKILYTDGVKYLADAAGAHWLIDAIASHYVTKRKLRAEDFLIVRLEVNRKPGAKFMARLTFHTDWDADNPAEYPSICTQRIPFTDLPLNEFKFYLIGETLMLPSEY